MYTSSFRIGGEDLILETGRIAKQANGSVLARYGGSVVLSTACCGAETTEGVDYVPLMVDYNERYYSAGKIPGGFIKRETRPKDKEILVSRLIDRPMRPLFDKRFGRDIQVIPMAISTDQIHTPDILGMIAAFASVEVSDIPFNGPLAAIRIGSVDNKFIVNPTFQQIEESELDIVIAGNNDGIVMVEGGANQISEQQMLEALEHAENVLKELCKYMSDFASVAGKKKLSIPDKLPPLSFEDEVLKKATSMLKDVVFLPDKITRANKAKNVKKKLVELFSSEIEAHGDNGRMIFDALLDKIHSNIMRQSIVNNQKRCDGRSPSEIRPISTEVGFLPRVHGSALFTRGETQSIGVATLGSTYDEQIFDDIDGDRRSRFMLHYNFPPYSVGETGRTGTGRREVGHGHLAQRAIEPVLPTKEEFPYTVRVVSEITESNGSSSMASVCSGTMSLLAAGVPIKAPVAGIAMGLIQENGKNVILSDILGEEDHMGDMDFKMTGSEAGITAFQMDIKVTGIGLDVIRNALEQAREGRLHILNEMLKTISKPSERISEYAPIVLTYNVDIDKIGTIIGPGGQNIRNISETSGAKVNIDDQGAITIFSRDGRSGAEIALNMVKALVEDPEVGKVYNGTVKRIVDFGAFIEILPGKEGLCHISKLSEQRVSSVEAVLKEGQRVEVRLIDVDRMGRFNLSIVDVGNPNWKPVSGVGNFRQKTPPPRRPRS
ncbi:Polyribonucleotide nucleotidyltransferase [Olavius algarvensis spirochete endosymbiont]|uniref:polyribonucleotide nucleotidyltransferase n=1 Tax=Olavius algarvensis spirochete endosymbiont TaxID=260710 RepID=UPI00097C5A52|nr:polyribonucleotide nucleotidyltransferase [Olavius algarvensis spirochete endosymbiont]CAD7837612.1 MAG: Polyribonucleotide nucleotidyltransferase (EC 2.7.7.8) [Olavius algarvensis spirochete endosymbiont]VDA99816.1 Polyribonucleotide nucleotidyltransferase [Olavius algarvensis spirochete endosymbiont]